MSIKPFDDAPPLIVPVLKARTSTKPFNAFRQGVSVTKNSLTRVGIITFTGKYLQVYGQSVKANMTSSFNDAQAANNLSYSQIKSFDGAIEPFAIRNVIKQNPISGKLVAHSVRGNLCLGNHTFFGGSNKATQFKPIKLPVSASIPYDDMKNVYLLRMSQSAKGPVLLSQPGRINQNVGVINPFDETAFKHNVKLSDTMEGAMKSALLQMQPSSSVFIPPDHVSSGAGFTYDNTSPFIHGTDSLAFGFDY